jgi:hypothetical protein
LLAIDGGVGPVYLARFYRPDGRVELLESLVLFTTVPAVGQGGGFTTAIPLDLLEEVVPLGNQLTFLVSSGQVLGGNILDVAPPSPIVVAVGEMPAGITVTPTSGLTTTEAGGTATFSVVLESPPTANVTIDLSSSDTTEGTVLPTSVTFTPANWNTAQTVTVTGVNDSVDDDNIAYTIVTAPAASADPNYNGLNAADVSVTNADNDTAGITVTPTSGLTTTEAGGTAAFTVVLNTQPTADVAISLSSNDATEGTAAPASLTFTPANWSTPQTVTITGVDDTLDDGNMAYVIVTAPAATADGKYNGLNAADVSVTNTDDDPLLTLTISQSSVSEAAGPNAAIATVSRTGDLSAALVVTIVNPDPTELYLPATVTIPINQASVQFNVETVNDGEIDPDQTNLIVRAQAAGFADATRPINVTNDDTALDRTLGGHLREPISANTYRVTYDIVVDAGLTLSVAPGSMLKFEANTRMDVDGVLTADANAGSEIVFTSAKATPAANDWQGIRIRGGSQPRSVLDHVVLAYAATGLEVASGSAPVTLSQSQVHHTQFGVFIDAVADAIGRDEVQVLNNRIHDNANGVVARAFAIFCSSASNAALIQGNEIDHNSTGVAIVATTSGGCVPAQVSVAANEVAGNFIHHNTIGLGSDTGSTPNQILIISGDIFNNVISDNSSHGMSLAAGAGETLQVRVFNNTIINSGGAGVLHDASAGVGPLLQNNLIVGNNRGIEAEAAFAPPASRVGFNNVFNNAAGNWVNYPASFGNPTTVNANGTPADAEFNISANPLFVAAGDFHVQPGSPVINAGTASTAPIIDYDGQPRTAPIDIGADEFAPLVNLDVDNNGATDALTDGILILRYLFGFIGTALTSGALGVTPPAQRTDPNAIVAYLDGARTTMLDPDNNGVADALTDGNLILRYLFGFTGAPLADGALGITPPAQRTDPAAILAFLASYEPPAPFSGPARPAIDLAPIANQTMLNDEALIVPLAAADPNLPLTGLSYTATANDYGYLLDQELALTLYVPLWDNWGGLHEKWILDANRAWYFIHLSGGQAVLRRWDGDSNPADDTLVAQLHRAYYDDPAGRLVDPTSIAFTPATIGVSAEMTIDPPNAFVGTLLVSVTVNDETESDTQSFCVQVNAASGLNSAQAVLAIQRRTSEAETYRTKPESAAGRFANAANKATSRRDYVQAVDLTFENLSDTPTEKDSDSTIEELTEYNR